MLDGCRPRAAARLKFGVVEHRLGEMKSRVSKQWEVVEL